MSNMDTVYFTFQSPSLGVNIPASLLLQVW